MPKWASQKAKPSQAFKKGAGQRQQGVGSVLGGVLASYFVDVFLRQVPLGQFCFRLKERTSGFEVQLGSWRTHFSLGNTGMV